MHPAVFLLALPAAPYFPGQFGGGGDDFAMNGWGGGGGADFCPGILRSILPGILYGYGCG